MSFTQRCSDHQHSELSSPAWADTDERFRTNYIVLCAPAERTITTHTIVLSWQLWWQCVLVPLNPWWIGDCQRDPARRSIVGFRVSVDSWEDALRQCSWAYGAPSHDGPFGVLSMCDEEPFQSEPVLCYGPVNWRIRRLPYNFSPAAHWSLF